MKKALLTLFLAASFISCQEDDQSQTDNCVDFVTEKAETVEELMTADFAAGTGFNVTFHCSNGCGQFDSFEQAGTGFTRTISVIAKYSGCICTDDLPEREGIFIFNPGTSGTYTLNFVSGEGNFITKTVTIP